MTPAIKLKQIKWRTVFLLLHFWHVIYVTTVFVSVIFDLFVCFRLMVNLTQPAVLCFGNNIPDDKTGQHYYLDLVTQLQSYKEVVYFNCRDRSLLLAARELFCSERNAVHQCVQKHCKLYNIFSNGCLVWLSPFGQFLRHFELCSNGHYKQDFLQFYRYLLSSPDI